MNHPSVTADGGLMTNPYCYAAFICILGHSVTTPTLTESGPRIRKQDAEIEK